MVAEGHQGITASRFHRRENGACLAFRVDITWLGSKARIRRDMTYNKLEARQIRIQALTLWNSFPYWSEPVLLAGTFIHDRQWSNHVGDILVSRTLARDLPMFSQGLKRVSWHTTVPKDGLIADEQFYTNVA